MNSSSGAATFALLLLTLPAAAPAQDHDGHHLSAHTSPYAAEEDSGISGLTVREIEQLENGEGMGFAKPAELNSYPGPRHVLDLAAELGLDEERTVRIQGIFDTMHADAVRLGKEIVENEATLDRRFQHRHLDDATLRQLTGEIGRLRGELRWTHLRAHLAVAELLTAEEIAAYDRLRGYAG